MLIVSSEVREVDCLQNETLFFFIFCLVTFLTVGGY